MSDFNLKIILTANGETTTLDPISGTPASVELSNLLADTDYEVEVILQRDGGNIDVASDSETFRTLSGDIDENTPFYLENLTENDASFTLTKAGTPDTLGLSYSLDNETWVDFDLTLAENAVKVPAYGRIYLRSVSGFSSDSDAYFTLNMDKQFKACGNIQYLLNYNKLDANLDAYCFYLLFYNATNLVDASSLLLPAMQLHYNCYEGMFAGCTSLTSAPALPATTVYNSSYSSMFYGCTSLTTAPELPATTVDSYCYQSMFQNCYSLTTAPELPATTLATACYQYMFSGCISLTTAPILPATTLETNCYVQMFYGCRSLTTAPELPATTLERACYAYMFNSCESLTTAPILPATTLADGCYINMFNGCRNLQSVTTYVTDWNTTNADQWLYNAGTLSTNPTIYCPANSTLKDYTNNNDGIPTGWTQVDL